MFLSSGTSNWSENYFTKTAGVGLVVNQTGSVVREGQQTLQSQVEELFLKDWSSPYASALSVDSVDVCPNLWHAGFFFPSSKARHTWAFASSCHLKPYFLNVLNSVCCAVLIFPVCPFLYIILFFIVVVLSFFYILIFLNKLRENRLCIIKFMPGAFCIFFLDKCLFKAWTISRWKLNSSKEMQLQWHVYAADAV